MPSRIYGCSRCKRSYSSHQAKQQHIRDSEDHNVCHICAYPPDFPTEDELNEHLEAEHDFCGFCNRQFRTPRQLAQHHVDKHNMCVVCLRYFDSPPDLKNHKIVHAEKNIQCPGCTRPFSTESAMNLHLEGGTCVSGMDRKKIDELAYACYESPSYETGKPGFKFECPTCQTPFTLMSGLLQHVESENCDEELGETSPLGIFLQFLRSRIDE